MRPFNHAFKFEGNRLQFSIKLTKEEDFFLGRYVWPTAVLEGKDIPLSDTNHVSVTHSGGYESGGYLHCEMQFTADVNLQSAYDQALQKQNELNQFIDDELKKYWDKREAWDKSFEMTLNALGLMERFEEGGES